MPTTQHSHAHPRPTVHHSRIESSVSKYTTPVPHPELCSPHHSTHIAAPAAREPHDHAASWQEESYMHRDQRNGHVTRTNCLTGGNLLPHYTGKILFERKKRSLCIRTVHTFTMDNAIHGIVIRVRRRFDNDRHGSSIGPPFPKTHTLSLSLSLSPSISTESRTFSIQPTNRKLTLHTLSGAHASQVEWHYWHISHVAEQDPLSPSLLSLGSLHPTSHAHQVQKDLIPTTIMMMMMTTNKLLTVACPWSTVELCRRFSLNPHLRDKCIIPFHISKPHALLLSWFRPTWGISSVQ